jgi:hypothetical protein
MLFLQEIFIFLRDFLKNGGGYVGSTLQLNKGDANRPRGWLECLAYREADGWKVDMEFFKTRPFFSRLEFNVGPSSKFGDFCIDEGSLADQLVEIKLSGNKADVDRVADDPKWKNYEDFSIFRKLDIVRAYNTVKSEVSVDMGDSNSLSDDLSLYIESGFANTGNVDKGLIFKALKDLGG